MKFSLGNHRNFARQRVKQSRKIGNIWQKTKCKIFGQDCRNWITIFATRACMSRERENLDIYAHLTFKLKFLKAEKVSHTSVRAYARCARPLLTDARTPLFVYVNVVWPEFLIKILFTVESTKILRYYPLIDAWVNHLILIIISADDYLIIF